jgi:hypothetical protein
MTNENPTVAPTEAAPTEESVPKLNRFQVFVLEHPRLSKVAAITGAIGTVGGVALLTSNLKKNSHRIDSAKEHLELAAGEFTEAVSPTSENTDN